MVNFTQVGCSRLFVAENDVTELSFLGLIFPSDATLPQSPIDLKTALASDDLCGSFVFISTAPDTSSADRIQDFIQKMDIIIESSASNQAIIWLPDIKNIKPENAIILPLINQGSRVAGTCEIPLVNPISNQSSLSIHIDPDANIYLNNEETELVIDSGSSPKIHFFGSSSPQESKSCRATLPFNGQLRGRLFYELFIERSSLNDNLNWGFQFLVPNSQIARSELAKWFPLASGRFPIPTDYLGFKACIDPLDMIDASVSRNTSFAFTGQNSDKKETTLFSWYCTDYGNQINLQPVSSCLGGMDADSARLVINLGTISSSHQQNFCFSPVGDFVMLLDDAVSGKYYNLLCGLAGGEKIRFRPQTSDYPGDRLRFVSNMPAFAPVFPLPQASVLSKPFDSNLSNRFLTSWATLVSSQEANEDIHYFVQPDGANLFGKDTFIHAKYPDLLGKIDTGAILPPREGFCMPMPPYAGAAPGDGVTSLSAEQMNIFEQQFNAPTRRTAVFTENTAHSIASTAISGSSNTCLDTTTPAGLIVRIEKQTGQWKWVQLAQNLKSGTVLQFLNLDYKLQQAFQANQQFLVITSNQYIGASGRQSLDDPAFDNAMWIEDWQFQANVGTNNNYNNYRNVMLFKYCPGKIVDLVKNTEIWTQANDFNAYQGSVGIGEKAVISQWLQDFINDGIEQYQKELSMPKEIMLFEKFYKIVTDENWNGLLFLKIDVKSLPDQLKGIVAGMDTNNFYAHHLGIEINQVKINQQNEDGQDADIYMEHTSSMFGLIDYIHPQYVPDSSQAVPPPEGALYDFKVLTLKVLFENTAVKHFESLAQLTLNRLFNHQIDHMGVSANIYNTIMLTGSCQRRNDQLVYTLDTLADNVFYLDSNILNKVEITRAEFATIDSGKNNGALESQIKLQGFMDFKKLQEVQALENTEKLSEIPENFTTKYFDIFSFGTEDDSSLRKGLCFSGLAVKITGRDAGSAVYVFDTSKITFDLAVSTYRNNCLFRNFALQLDGFISGDDNMTPSDQGFLQAGSEIRLVGISSKWNGLVFRLNMGTPGELAGKLNLNSKLLIAWDPGSKKDSKNYAAFIGIKLPSTGGGAKLISLQGVMQLSINDIRLQYINDQNSFMLVLSDIALKFLGILKLPPNGSTSFYLFGNPDNTKELPDGLGWYAIYNQDHKKLNYRKIEGEQNV